MTTHDPSRRPGRAERATRSVLRRLGFDIVRHPPRLSLQWNVTLVFERLGINCVLDVGANHGQYIIRRAVISPERADPDLKWARYRVPVPLSVDNVVGGAALGLAGYSPWLAPVLFGLITFGMSVAGHQIGRTVASVVDFVPRINTDLLTGIGFAALAVLAALGVHLPLSDN